LNIGNYESNVVDNINQIAEFIEAWKNKVIAIKYSCIDMEQKEEKRLQFFSKYLQ
jgi:hypothetical protein